MKPLLLLLSLCLLVAVAGATVRHVPGQYPTIQAGINAASPGDTVLVAPGTYTENVQMHEGVSLFGSGMDKTIVDGGGLTNVIASASGVLNLVIADLSARNSMQSGSNPGSTGIFMNPISSSGVKVVRRCHVYNCGFGIEIWNDFGGTAYIENNIINNNLYDGFYPYLGTVYLRHNTIVNNGRDGYNDWSGGGAIYLESNIIAGNGRYGIYKHLNTPVFISYDDVWNNAQGAYYQGYSGPAQPFVPQPGTGEIAANPRFLGPPFTQIAQYCLTWTHFPTPDSTKSPCIDTGNPDPQFNDPDGTRGDMGALFFDQTVHLVDISFSGVGSPQIPPQGGSFTYTINLYNHELGPWFTDIWIMVTLPNGSLYGPVTGPARLNIPYAIPVSRSRSQFVPASAPPGTYTYWGFVGIYPNHAWDAAHFTFTKQAAEGDGGVMNLDEWLNTEVPGDVTPLGTAASLQPSGFALLSCSPNPFNASTVASYELRVASHVRFTVWDTIGRQVASLVDGWQQAGTHSATFNGTNLAAGMYLSRLEVDGQAAMSKMVLLK